VTLEKAAAAVLRDGGPPEPVAAAVEHRRWWLAQWADGAPYVLGLLAQDVQEAVHAHDPLWPACLETSCPERLAQPMFVEPDLGPDPFWTCHRTGLPVAAVGQLRGSAA